MMNPNVLVLKKGVMIVAIACLTACAGKNTKDVVDETYNDDINSSAAAATSETAENSTGYNQTGYRDGAIYSESSSRSPSQGVSLQTVFYFGYDQSILTPESRAALDVHADFLQHDNSPIRLEGHADERGTREYNMALGERRANAVANYLVSKGIARNRIETISYGEEHPMAFGNSEAAYQQNRRVEIK